MLVSPEVPPVLRVLCVDDEAVLLEDLASELRDDGCVVVTAADGHDALACAMAEPFDAIVCDMNLPGLTGLDMLVRLRGGHGPNKTTQFLLLTGEKNAQLKASCEGSGNAFYILKPADYGELLEALRRSPRSGHRADEGLTPPPPPRTPRAPRTRL